MNLMTNPKRILVVDDEVSLNQLIATNLMIEGYEVESALNGAEALARITAFAPHLVLLDVTMPDMDGFEVLEQIRRSSSVPVIMLTARIGIPDRVKGLRGGADDYVTKPFALDELLARVEVQLRREAQPDVMPEPEEKIIRVGELSCDPAAFCVTARGTEVVLQKLEFRLLQALMEAAGRALSHDYLLSELWDDEPGDLATLRVTVGKLRAKLRDALGEDPISTVRGVGYRLRKPE